MLEFAVPLDTTGSGQAPGAAGPLYRDTFDPVAQSVGRLQVPGLRPSVHEPMQPMEGTRTRWFVPWKPPALMHPWNR